MIQVQLWCGLLLAQLFHGLQVQLAHQAGVDPFEVSLDLLVQLVPRWLERGLPPLPTLLERGRAVGLNHPRPTRRAVPTPDGSLRAAQVCAGTSPLGQEGQMSDAPVRFCWNQ